MKNIKYILFMLMLFFSNVFIINASCTDDRFQELKDLADDIKITYKHMGKTIGEEGNVLYNVFEVKAKNIYDDFYFMVVNEKYAHTDGEFVGKFSNGTWYFEIYSNSCNQKISEIKVFIPRFNEYSLDPLCEGVEGDDFALCGKYYEYEVGYDEFVNRVTNYRNTHDIVNVNDDDKINKFNWNNILGYIINYQQYIIVFVSLIILVIFLLVYSKNRKKRGVLE